jgi:hypothetical protein
MAYEVSKKQWKSGHNLDMTIELPEYAYVVRNLGLGLHPYRTILPRLEESPVARRIETATMPLGPLMDDARVLITNHEGFCFVDIKYPRSFSPSIITITATTSTCISIWRTN